MSHRERKKNKVWFLLRGPVNLAHEAADCIGIFSTLSFDLFFTKVKKTVMVGHMA